MNSGSTVDLKAPTHYKVTSTPAIVAAVTISLAPFNNLHFVHHVPDTILKRDATKRTAMTTGEGNEINEPVAVDHAQVVNWVKQTLELSGLAVNPGVTTPDDSVFFRLVDNNDLAVDVYPNGDIVLVQKKGEIRYYHEYELSGLAKVVSILKHEVAAV